MLSPLSLHGGQLDTVFCLLYASVLGHWCWNVEACDLCWKMDTQNQIEISSVANRPGLSGHCGHSIPEISTCGPDTAQTYRTWYSPDITNLVQHKIIKNPYRVLVRVKTRQALDSSPTKIWDGFSTNNKGAAGFNIVLNPIFAYGSDSAKEIEFAHVLLFHCQLTMQQAFYKCLVGLSWSPAPPCLPKSQPRSGLKLEID